MSGVMGVLMLVHATAHLVGFAGPYELVRGAPTHATAFGHHFGSAMSKLIGALWLCFALAFFACAIGAFRKFEWWPIIALVCSLGSLAMCVSALPETRFGVAANVLLIVALALGRALGWQWLR